MPPAGLESDDELLPRIRAGDEQAFAELYHRRQGMIYRFALHMSGSGALAEDVTQEVFLALIRGTCGYDPERGELSNYLFGIARKLVLRHMERGRADVALESEDGLPAQAPELAVQPVDLTRQETIEVLRRAVFSLPSRYREVVVLCDLEEMDYADAALAIGCAIGTVRSRLHRARALLLEKLNRGRRPATAVDALKPARCQI
jgi:RNA polymerase sigma-70 factor, ECF subfamily